MQKKSKKQDIELAALLFLVGLLLFIYPVVNQVSSYHTDEEEYGDLAMLFMQPESSPAPMMPIPKQTRTPTDEPPGLETQLISNNVSETESQESDQTERVETPAKAQASSMPSVIPEYSEASDDTEIPLLPTANVTAVPTAIVTAVPSKKPFTPTAVPTQSDIDLEACLTQNRDFEAWLTIPGTKINYPVVRSNNTEYYLHHLFNGKESKLGCLFSLTSSDYQTPSKNIAIYGHHIASDLYASDQHGDPIVGNAVIVRAADEKLELLTASEAKEMTDDLVKSRDKAIGKISRAFGLLPTQKPEPEIVSASRRQPCKKNDMER